MQIGTECVNNVFYVGVFGENLESDFFNAAHNATSGAYLIKGDKTALVDTVHGALTDKYIEAVEAITQISEIDYFICNYTGTEYLRTVTEIIKRNPNIEIVATIPAIKNLKEMTNTPFNEHIAKNGATLDLGGKTLEFIITPYLPWQDTMITYLHEDNAMFSGRLFTPNCEMLMPFREYVNNALQLISERKVSCIFTSDGDMLNGDIDFKIREYSEFFKPDDKLQTAVFCPKRNKNTASMAETILKTLLENGVNAKLYNVDDLTDETIRALNTADALVFGTPTLNKNASPKMWRLLSELDAVNAKGKPYFVFGSYGWSGEGAELMHRHLVQLRLRPFEKPLCAVFTPSESDYKNITEYVRRFVKGLQNNWQ